jgi:uroporphyrinogen decarboxylase
LKFCVERKPMDALTPRENFWKAVNHEEPERVPIFWGGSNSSIVPSHYQALCAYFGIPLHGKGAGDFGVVNLHRDLKERFHSDVELLLMGAPHRERLSPDIIRDGMWGFLMKDVGGFRTFPDPIAPLREAKTIKDIEAHPLWPNPDDPVYYYGQAEKARKIYETGKIVLGEPSYAAAPFFIYPWLRGVDLWMMDPYRNPDLYRYLAQKITALSAKILERWLELVGPYLDVVCFYDDIAMQTGPMVSLPHYRKWILPYEKQLTDIARRMTKARRSIHCCGSCFDLLPGFIETGYEILNPVQTRARNMEAWRLKKEYGERLTFYGGVDVQRLLPFGTADEVRAGVREVIRTLGKDGGLLFATSHNIEPDTPIANIVALFDTAQEFGRYPLATD